MKTILITGASSGIGKATAQAFLNHGWNVVATMRNPTAGADLASQENALVVPLDVKDTVSIEAAIKAGIARFGGIDALLNNAGLNYFGAFEELSSAHMRDIFEVNFFGVLEVTRAILPHFRSRRAGVLVNLGSAAGLLAFPLGTLYDATKHALEGFSEALAYELLSLGITVKLIEPGLVKTNMTVTFKSDVAPADVIPDYANFVAHTIGLFEGMMEGDIPEASFTAERIYAATTDGTERLRYLVTDEVAPMLEKKHSLPNEEFVAHMRSLFVPAKEEPGAENGENVSSAA